jgi:hypothetical protein
MRILSKRSGYQRLVSFLPNPDQVPECKSGRHLLDGWERMARIGWWRFRKAILTALSLFYVCGGRLIVQGPTVVVPSTYFPAF